MKPVELEGLTLSQLSALSLLEISSSELEAGEPTSASSNFLLRPPLAIASIWPRLAWRAGVQRAGGDLPPAPRRQPQLPAGLPWTCGHGERKSAPRDRARSLAPHRSTHSPGRVTVPSPAAAVLSGCRAATPRQRSWISKATPRVPQSFPPPARRAARPTGPSSEAPRTVKKRPIFRQSPQDGAWQGGGRDPWAGGAQPRSGEGPGAEASSSCPRLIRI